MDLTYKRLNIANTVCAAEMLLFFVISIIRPEREIELFKFRMAVALLIVAIIYSVVVVILSARKGEYRENIFLLGKQILYMTMIHIPMALFTLIAYALSSLPTR